ncbi:MAG: hypothetical protein JST00_38955 [Deltaproteobacteria bacterium]|nr:hypothetical protein [Deltaproteobacteria bacterium]
MIRSARAERLALSLGALSLLACEDTTPAATSARPSASAPPPWSPPPPEGCIRAGTLEAVEADPACVVQRVSDSTMRETMKALSIALAPDAATVNGGATALLRLTMTNTSDQEISVVLDAQPPGAVARPDWSRLAGVPEPRPSPSGAPVVPEGFRLLMPVRTLDASGHSVDGLPSSPPSGSTATPRILRVRLRPRAKLTQTISWWALRIPVPAPITRDDAGHRYVPKTVPQPLPPGEYTIAMELPLHGLSAPETTITTRIRVEKVDPDAGPR